MFYERERKIGTTLKQWLEFKSIIKKVTDDSDWLRVRAKQRVPSRRDGPSEQDNWRDNKTIGECKRYR